MVKKVTLIFGARRLLSLKNCQKYHQNSFFQVFQKILCLLINCSKIFLFWHASYSREFLMFLCELLRILQMQMFHISSCNALLHHQIRVKSVLPFLLACQKKWGNNGRWEKCTPIAQFYLILYSFAFGICHCVCLLSLLGTSTATAEYF